MVPSTEPIAHVRERTRVLFVLGSLAGGGAERMVSYLVRHMDRDEFDPRVGVLWRHGPYLRDLAEADLVVPRFCHGWIPYRDRPPWWQLMPALVLVPLQQYDVLRQFRPHVVVTATKAMNIAARVALGAFGRRRTVWIAREGNNTTAMIESESRGPLACLQHLVVRSTYRSADRVVAISRGVATELAQRFNLEPSRIRAIANAVDIVAVQARASAPLVSPPAGSFIVAAGRLDHQKGFDVLIRAFAAGPASRGLSLVILGEGRERPALERLARELNVGASVLLPGFVSNPWAYFARATLFACSSRWEGFGNVIIEAMACGAPVVAGDCDFGPREIVEPGTSGLLVPVDDAPALAAAMNAVLDDRNLASRLAEGGRHRAQAFAISRMTDAYARLVREVAAAR